MKGHYTCAYLESLQVQLPQVPRYEVLTCNQSVMRFVRCYTPHRITMSCTSLAQPCTLHQSYTPQHRAFLQPHNSTRLHPHDTIRGKSTLKATHVPTSLSLTFENYRHSHDTGISTSDAGVPYLRQCTYLKHFRSPAPRNGIAVCVSDLHIPKLSQSQNRFGVVVLVSDYEVWGL